MLTLLMVLFVILCLILAAFVLIQQGKGDLGLGSLARSSQTIFGGSGGQDFFEKITWALGTLFMCGALLLSILKNTDRDSKLKEYQSPLTIEQEKSEKKQAKK